MQLYHIIHKHEFYKRLENNKHMSSYLFLLMSSFLACYESQKFPYDSTVLHDGLHVDGLTVCKHLVTESIDWTIPDRERRRGVIKQYGHTHCASLPANLLRSLLIFYTILYDQWFNAQYVSVFVHTVPARWDHQQLQEEEVWIETVLSLL